MFDSEINRKEIERYLGYAGHTPDEFTSALIETCVRELIDISSPRNYYLSFPIVWGKSADPEIIPITIDSMTIKSISGAAPAPCSSRRHSGSAATV